MSWLSECAHLITRKHQPVSWVSPLGLPITQPYRKTNSYKVKTVMQQVMVAEHSDLLPVSSERQKAAFPPNFVHSLDASHMMMTALDCCAKGLTYTSVHDSYWTHACDVDTMNESLRDQFISLYSQPILEDLRESFCVRYPGIVFPPLPKRGTLDIHLVKKSSYFFN